MQEAYSGLPAAGESPLLLESNCQAGEQCPAVGADLMIQPFLRERQVTEAAGMQHPQQ